MIFSALKKLLTNNNRFKPEDAEYRRIIMLNIVLVLFIDFCVFYAIFILSLEKILATVIDMSAAVLGLAMMIFFHKTDKLKIVSYALIAVFSCCLYPFLFAGPRGISCWICVFPPLTYFLLGRKEATIALGLILTAWQFCRGRYRSGCDGSTPERFQPAGSSWRPSSLSGI
jgi:hypothetical protein